MLKRFSKVLSISVIASITIAGCAVKPEPMLNDDVKKQIETNLTVLKDVAVPVTAPITIDEAIKRGLEHNLSKKVKVLETALAQQQLDLVYYDMLPSLTASAGLSERNNYAASASTSFVNGEPQPLG